jgi:hypothetical protein
MYGLAACPVGGSGMEEHAKKPTIFGWADTPWTVAALLGAWGVMIGIEEFFLADVFMVLAGVSCTARLARDCFHLRRRRWVPFVLWIAIIASVIGVDLHLTEKKKASSEAKAGQVTDLTTQVKNLNGTVQKQSIELSAEQGHTDQHVSDIQDENKRLRASIDRKDAALVSIAKQQYALNFFPQVVISTEGVVGQLQIINNGKTNVTVYQITLEGVPQDVKTVPALISAQSKLSFEISDIQKSIIVSRDPTALAERIPVEGVVYLSTQDKKKYSLGFTWFFKKKDGKLTEGNTVDHPIVEITPQ